jgi:hypothetical protein
MRDMLTNDSMRETILDFEKKTSNGGEESQKESFPFRMYWRVA